MHTMNQIQDVMSEKNLNLFNLLRTFLMDDSLVEQNSINHSNNWANTKGNKAMTNYIFENYQAWH